MISATDRLLRRDNDHADGIHAGLTGREMAATAAIRIPEAHPGIDVHITTSINPAYFKSGDVDAAIRWRLRAMAGRWVDWLDGRRIASGLQPAAAGGQKRCGGGRKTRADLMRVAVTNSAGNNDDWCGLADGRGAAHQPRTAFRHHL
jgi:LysR family glycine cleavage system transcriptional activator